MQPPILLPPPHFHHAPLPFIRNQLPQCDAYIIPICSKDINSLINLFIFLLFYANNKYTKLVAFVR